MLSSTPVLCELAQSGLIRYSGEDAQSFLHNLLTCDVGELAQGKSTYGGFCTPKGRLLATFLLWRSGADTIMQLPSPLRDPIQKKLSMFILRAKVKASDASNEWVKFGLAGSDAESLVKRAFGQAPLSPHDVLEVEGATLIHLPGGRCEIIVARDKAPALREALSRSAKTVNPDYWDWLDIRAGIPSILPATQEEFVPQMVNLDSIGGLSLSKGCYPGQEIVARMHYRGTLKQRMVLANIISSGSPQPGDKLYSPGMGEQSSGKIVNAARAPEGGSDVLAVIQIAAAERGDVRWKSLDGSALKFLPLPYAVNLNN